jgi:hypothetical protein
MINRRKDETFYNQEKRITPVLHAKSRDCQLHRDQAGRDRAEGISPPRAAGVFDLVNISDLAHQTENVLVLIRSREMVPTAERVRALLFARFKNSVTSSDKSAQLPFHSDSQWYSGLRFLANKRKFQANNI